MADYAARANAALLAIQTCNSGTTAPANGPTVVPVHFQCWADTTSNPVVYKFYDGASWVIFGALNTSTHVWTPYRSGVAIAAVATSSSAADLTTGTLPAARLPVPTASTLGGVQSKTCSASQWLFEISTSGVPACSQPNFTDLAGTAALAQLPAFSGMSAATAAADADTFPTNQGAGNLKQTLAAIKTWIKAWIVKADVGLGNVDNTSDTTKWAASKTLTNTAFACNGTGNSCVVRIGADVTGLGTGIATALAVNTGSAGAPVLFNGALGTPSSGIATNLTGTAAGLTAGNVTTNANLTGEVTSVGNATTVTNASVIAKVLTAFSAGAGTVSSSDSILTAFQKVVGNLALKANSASPVFTGVEDNQGTLKLSSFVTSTQITANQNDYTATDGSNTCSTKTTLRLSTNASRNVTGLSCGQAEGDIRIIHNVGTFAAVLTNQDAGSTAANRFLLGGDMTLAADTSVTIRYDGVASRWRAITTPGAGGGGGGVTSVTIAGSGLNTTSGTCTITTSGTCTVTAALPPRYWSGCQHSNNVSTPNTKVDVSSCTVRDSTDAINITATAKTIDFGTVGANGIDAGSLAATTKYYTFIIMKADLTAAALGSLSPTAPTLPSGYVYFRRVGMVKTNASSQILPFTQVNNRWFWTTTIRDVNNSSVGTTTITAPLSVPNVQGVIAFFASTGFAAAAVTYYVWPGFLPDTARNGFAINISATGGGTLIAQCPVDSSGQIKYASGSASTTVVLDVAGWQDDL
ncbi:hypothetical protein AB8B21_05775 [Tardiphaga sp. 866_E4_N2_1]|uniref:hypothetical protein n=1 Tax=unclassified Tardiphaga TaxID=2631404 RepID=UPI003F25118E